jgi:hypothetical protein
MKWTHENVKLTDIRRSVRKDKNNYKVLYVITIDDEEIKTPLFISEKIFRDRVESYFLQDINNISREMVSGVTWNFLITKGHYVKIDKNGNVNEVDSNPNKYYISYLEISGPLGTLQSSKLAEEDEFDKL